MAKIEIDMRKLDEAVAQAYKAKAGRKRVQDADEDADSVRAFSTAEASLGIEDAAGAFCTAWPKARRFIVAAITSFGWLAPRQAALATAVVDAIDKYFVPVVCTAE